MLSPSDSAPPPRSSVWEWAQLALLGVNLAWTTLCFGGYRAETMVVTSALTGALVAVHGLAWAFGGRSGGEGASERGWESGWGRVHPASWLLLPFLAWVVVNILWVTPVRWLGWRDGYGWAQAAAVFWVVLNGITSRAARSVLLGALLALGAVAAGLACYQRWVQPDWLMLGRVQVLQFIGRSSGPFGSPNSLAALLLLVLPAAGVLAWRRAGSGVGRGLAGALTALLLLGLVLTISRGAWLALAVALVAWPLFAPGRLGRRVAMAGAVTLGAVAFMALVYAAIPLVRLRAYELVRDRGEMTRPIMWRGAWEIARAHPLAGGGAGSYNVLFERYRPLGYRDEPEWAHNDYLNTLSDYGAVGLGLSLGAVAAMIVGARRARRVHANTVDAPECECWIDDPTLHRALAVSLLAFALHLLVDFHLKIPALAMAFAVVAALVVRRAWPISPSSHARSTATPARARAPRRSYLQLGSALTIAIAAVVVAVTAAWIIPAYRAEALRAAARASLDALASKAPPPAERGAILARAGEQLTRATALDPANAQAWADLAYATVQRAHLEPARAIEIGREAERAAAEAVRLAPLLPEALMRRGIALDLQDRWAEAGEDFIAALRLGSNNPAAWLFQAIHLSIKPNTRELARAAVETCLRLDPQNSAALNLRQRLASSR